MRKYLASKSMVLAVIGSATLLSGCGSTGLFNRDRPDEFAVQRQAPLVIPPDFERDVVRGHSPQILLAADASDPAAAGGAVAAINGIVTTAISETLSGALTYAASSPPPFSVVVHRQFNPEGQTSTNIVPGLLAIILSMTMVMITAVAIVRETERGTMETLISTPVRPGEVMLG